MSAAERWDIVQSAALATRMALEQYIPAYHRDKAIDAAVWILRSDAPDNVKFKESVLAEESAED